MPVWNISQSAVGGVAMVSGTVNPITDDLAIGSDGQTSFTLSTSPLDTDDVNLFLNGVRQRQPEDYLAVDTAVSWVSAYELKTTDSLIAFYFGAAV